MAAFVFVGMRSGDAQWLEVREPCQAANCTSRKFTTGPTNNYQLESVMETKLRVWWIPQVPMKPFYVDVATLEEGVKITDILADYDAFQFENNIKPDYCNVGGIQLLDTDGEWVDWYDEETGEDEPARYLADKALATP